MSSYFIESDSNAGPSFYEIDLLLEKALLLICFANGTK